ncbi:hypothetical protein A9R01_13370 ['Osedax' symbiont bacterium Rs2_46_30_T18]|nr:hypothetical protein A9R01_13370 ['Osedax' symbiont bacterium Rs2_46_30_T18]
MPVIRIEAFTFEYNELQDRIRLTGNLYAEAQEISFWFTRRLALRLLDAAVELVKKTSPSIVTLPEEHQSAMALFEHQSAQLDTDNITESPLQTKEGGDRSNSDAEPKILRRLDISCKDQTYQLSFFLSGSGEAVAVSKLSYSQLHQLLSLIHRGALALDWGVENSLFASARETPITLQ